MQRILIIGSGGSGKSTLARQLSEILRLEVIHLDNLFWNPGWVETEQQEWKARLRDVLQQDSWIIDGNYSGSLPERMAACDTVIFLDLSRVLCLWRVLKRVMQYYGRTRPDLPEGCPERFDFEFMKWVWNYPARSRQKVLKLLDAHRHTKKVFRLRSRRGVNEFIAAQA